MSLNNVTNAINSNQNIYNALQSQEWKTNKNFLLSAYEADKVIYYNDEKAQKKAKKKKIGKILALSFAGLSVAGIIGTAIVSVVKNKGKIDFSKIQDNIQNSEQTQKAMNMCINFASIKDDLLHRFTSKIPIFDKAAGKLKNVYNKITINSNAKEYDALLENVRDISKKEGIQIDKLPEKFEEYAKGINESISSELEKGEPLSKGLVNFKNLVHHPIQEAKNFINKISGSILANDKIENTLKNYGTTTYPIPEGASEQLKDAINKLNDKHKKINADLIERLRDNNIGCAAFDAASNIGSLALLGGAVAVADDKEDKKSIMLNLGIPLITSLATITYGNMKCISGFKNMIFGLATGSIASTISKSIDKATSKNKNKEKNQNKNKEITTA